MRYEVNAVMPSTFKSSGPNSKMKVKTCFWQLCFKEGAHKLTHRSSQEEAPCKDKKKEHNSNKREGQNTRKSQQSARQQQASKHMRSNLQNNGLLPQRVCCPWLCAMPVQHLQAPEQAREDTAPRKIDVTSNPPVGGISVVTLIRTDTTLDHSQKAEKV